MFLSLVKQNPDNYAVETYPVKNKISMVHMSRNLRGKVPFLKRSYYPLPLSFNDSDNEMEVKLK